MSVAAAASTTALVAASTAPANPDPVGEPDSNPDADPLGDEIALLCAHINAATYELLRLLVRYDEEGRWGGGGFRSCAHWLSWRTGISIGPAREKVRVARCLPSLPLISEALASGVLSYSKVRALTRVATAENEAELLTLAHHGTTSHVEHLVRLWRRVDQDMDSQAARAERRGLSLWPTDDGSYEVRGRLSPEVGALLRTALEVAEDKLYRAEREAGIEHRTSPTQRRADAMGLWLEERVQPKVQLVVHAFEGEGGTPDGDGRTCDGKEGEERPAALVTEEGGRVSGETSSRLACDAEVVPIARGADGSVLDVGRRQRTVGWRLRKALEARDGGCRFPGCHSRMRTHAHHMKPWAAGGKTAMDNLVLLCPFHHRAVHEGGWRVKMDEWGIPRFFNPLGVPLPVVPEAPDVRDLVPRDASLGRPADATLPSNGAPASPTQDFGLARWHGQRGINAWTGSSLYCGGHVDWDWALAWFLREGAEADQATGST